MVNAASIPSALWDLDFNLLAPSPVSIALATNDSQVNQQTRRGERDLLQAP